MSPESPQRPLADGRDDLAICVCHALRSPAVYWLPPAHGLPRRIAVEPLLASEAEGATVTLSYLPGADRLARVNLLLDGAPSAAVVIPRSFCRLEGEWLHKRFVEAEVELSELARWGQRAEGLPRECEAARPHRNAQPQSPTSSERNCSSKPNFESIAAGAY